jgi:hypothetical protein
MRLLEGLPTDHVKLARLWVDYQVGWMMEVKGGG